MKKRKVSRITESAAFFLLALNFLPDWIWGMHYKSSPDVYSAKSRQDRRQKPEWWEGQSIHTVGYAGEFCCLDCGQRKLFTEFYENHTYTSGIESVCKACKNAADKRRYRKKVGNRALRRYGMHERHA